MSGSAKKNWIEILAVVLLFCFWIWLCAPVFQNFTSRLYLNPNHIDSIGQYWMAWWANQAFSSADFSIFECPLLNYPVGARVFVYDIAYLHAWAAGALIPVFGLAGAINAVFCFAVLFSLLGTYILLRQFTKNQFLAVALSTIPIIHRLFLHDWFVDLELANIGFMSLAIALWFVFLRKGGAGWMVAASLALGAASIFQMYYGISVFVLFLICLACSFFDILPVAQPVRLVRKRTLFVGALGGTIALAGLLPSIASLFTSGGQPGHGSLFMGTISSGYGIPFTFFVPASIFGLFLFVSFRNNKTAWFLLIAATSFCLLGTGPYMELGETNFRIPMPLWLFYKLIPFFWRFTTPARFAIPAVLLFTCLAAFYWQSSIDTKKTSVLKTAASIALVFFAANFIMAVVEGNKNHLLPNFRQLHSSPLPPVPDIFQQMQKDQEKYAVFDGACENEATWSNYYQVTHQKPIAGFGLIPVTFTHNQKPARLSGIHRDFCLAVKKGSPVAPPSRKLFAGQNVRYFIFYKGSMGNSEQEFLIEAKDSYGDPVFTDDSLLVFDLKNSSLVID